MTADNSILALHYQPGETNNEIKLLTASLLHWGGWLKNTSHWIFEGNGEPGCEKATFPPGFLTFTPEIPVAMQTFPFAAKVFMAAQAESRAESEGCSEFIWLDPDNLFIHEPNELLLKNGEMIALSPVHLRNISSVADEPMDDFWKLVYSHCHVAEDQIFKITTIAERLSIRAHFNAGLIALNPRLGIMRRWYENFLSLYLDLEMQRFYAKDIRYKIFVHQAILSATVLSMCRQSEIRILPPTYNFPLHLVDRIEESRRPACLEELTTVRYDDFNKEGWTTALTMGKEYQQWLEQELNRVGFS